MDVTKTAWRRRWLPPLILLGALIGLAGGVMIGLTAETRGLRLVGWFMAFGAICSTVSASWLLWWVTSGRDNQQPR